MSESLLGPNAIVAATLRCAEQNIVAPTGYVRHSIEHLQAVLAAEKKNAEALTLAVHRFLAASLTAPVWQDTHLVAAMDDLRAALAAFEGGRS